MSRAAPIVTVVIGLLLSICGPIGGIVFTSLGLSRSFRAVDDVPASQRATELSQGISDSMWGTTIGLIVGGVGLVVLIVGAVWLGFSLFRPKDQ